MTKSFKVLQGPRRRQGARRPKQGLPPPQTRAAAAASPLAGTPGPQPESGQERRLGAECGVPDRREKERAMAVRDTAGRAELEFRHLHPGPSPSSTARTSAGRAGGPGRQCRGRGERGRAALHRRHLPFPFSGPTDSGPGPGPGTGRAPAGARTIPRRGGAGGHRAGWRTRTSGLGGRGEGRYLEACQY